MPLIFQATITLRKINKILIFFFETRAPKKMTVSMEATLDTQYPVPDN